MTRLARELFDNENAEKIAVRKIDGEYWYMGSDICWNVDIKNSSVAIHGARKDEYGLTDEEWRKETIYIGGYGKKKVVLVNESGMKKLIMQGKSPKALAIQERLKNIQSKSVRPDNII